MSDKRDLIWFRSAPATHFTSFKVTTVANTVELESIPASSTYVIRGMVPSDAHKDLKGTIEHIGVYQGTSAAATVTVFIYSSDASVTGSATLSNNHYVDHEPFIINDFVEIAGQTSVQFSAKNTLDIPYMDKTSSKKFHIGVHATTNANPNLLNSEGIMIEWAWRPDAGEN